MRKPTPSAHHPLADLPRDFGAVLAGNRRIAVDRTITPRPPVEPSIAGLPEVARGFVPVERDPEDS